MYYVGFKTTGAKLTCNTKLQAEQKAISMSTKYRTVFVHDKFDRIIFAARDKKSLTDKLIWEHSRDNMYKYVVADKNGNMKMIRYYRREKPINTQNEVKFVTYSVRESITFKVSKSGIPYGVRVAGKKISTIHDENVIREWDLIPDEVKVQFAKEYVDKFEDESTAMNYSAQKWQAPEHIKSYSKYSRIDFGDSVLLNLVKNVGYEAFNPERKFMYKVCKMNNMPNVEYTIVTLRVLPNTRMVCYDKKCFKTR